MEESEDPGGSNVTLREILLRGKEYWEEYPDLTRNVVLRSNLTSLQREIVPLLQFIYNNSIKKGRVPCGEEKIDLSKIESEIGEVEKEISINGLQRVEEGKILGFYIETLKDCRTCLGERKKGKPQEIMKRYDFYMGEVRKKIIYLRKDSILSDSYQLRNSEQPLKGDFSVHTIPQSKESLREKEEMFEEDPTWETKRGLEEAIVSYRKMLYSVGKADSRRKKISSYKNLLFFLYSRKFKFIL
jgi:hypothetical protein